MCAPDVDTPDPVEAPPAPEETATNVRSKATNPNRDKNSRNRSATGLNQLRVDLQVPGSSGGGGLANGLTGLLFPGS